MVTSPRTRRTLALASGLLAAACAGRSAAAPGSFQELRTAHFVLEFTERDATSMQALAVGLESYFPRVTGNLRVSSMPMVRITFYADHASLAAAVRPVVGDIPSWATALATSADRIHLMTTGPGTSGLLQTLVHELTHCVSLAVNPTFGNRPRWLWESVALYEAGQFVDPRTVAALAGPAPPSFATLNAIDNTLIYQVGYTLIDFILSTWNRDALRALILANGDTDQTLGVPLEAFGQQWFQFLKVRYGLAGAE